MGSAAARRYAQALFQLAREDTRVNEVKDELEAIASLFAQSAELRDALLTPLHPAAERKAVLAALAGQLGLSTSVKNFYSYLIDRRRLVDFESICEAYQTLADDASGLVTAKVVTASPLDDRRKDRLRRALSERAGREVRLDIEVDPALVAGAIATVGDVVFDGSLRTQLGQLRSNLMKGS